MFSLRIDSHKKRFLLLLAAMVILAFASYKLAIKRSLLLSKQVSELSEKMQEKSAIENDILLVKNELKRYGSSKILPESGSHSFQELLLDKIADYCKNNQVLIAEMPSSETYTDNNIQIETSRIVLSGRYRELLSLINSLERRDQLGKVAHARFFTKINRKNRQTELYVEIYLQHITISRI